MQKNPALGADLSTLLTSDYWGMDMADPASHKSFRPLTSATLKLDWMMWGTSDAAPWRVTSAALHAVTTAAVHAAALDALKDQAAAAAVSLLFAVQPSAVEAVTSVANRGDVLCGLLSLVSAAVWNNSEWYNTPTLRHTTD